MDEATAAGILISFDLNFRAALWQQSEAAPVLRELVSRADVVSATEDEARIISFTAPPEPVIEVDPVGAGDALAAGYLSEICLDADPATRLHTASLAGAFAVTVAGDWEGAPNRAELEALAAKDHHVAR